MSLNKTRKKAIEKSKKQLRRHEIKKSPFRYFGSAIEDVIAAFDNFAQHVSNLFKK
ncbi:TPA: hypothetical protein ACGOWO_000455 [Streptococcus suis]